MRILLAGAFRYFWYEEACARALEALGHAVVRVRWDACFRNPVGRVEERWVVSGPATAALNLALRRAAARARADVILVWRGIHVWPATVRRLRDSGACVVSYNNDDPYGPTRDWRLWRYFHRAIREYDAHYVYRPVNLREYRDAGARKVGLLMPYFVPALHRPVTLSPADIERYGCDVVFVGHYEDDGRIDALRALAASGVRLRLFGTGWTRSSLHDLSTGPGPVHPVYLEDYVRALAGAELCLAFLSKMNRDPYTRRSFEIPACGRPMLSERSAELAGLFKEDEEAVFFSSPNELVQKVRSLLGNDDRRRGIGSAGRERCLTDGHDVVSRMREWVKSLA